MPPSLYSRLLLPRLIDCVRIPRDGEQGFRVKMNGIPEGREHDSTGT